MPPRQRPRHASALLLLPTISSNPPLFLSSTHLYSSPISLYHHRTFSSTNTATLLRHQLSNPTISPPSLPFFILSPRTFLPPTSISTISHSPVPPSPNSTPISPFLRIDTTPYYLSSPFIHTITPPSQTPFSSLQPTLEVSPTIPSLPPPTNAPHSLKHRSSSPPPKTPLPPFPDSPPVSLIHLQQPPTSFISL